MSVFDSVAGRVRLYSHHAHAIIKLQVERLTEPGWASVRNLLKPGDGHHSQPESDTDAHPGSSYRSHPHISRSSHSYTAATNRLQLHHVQQ